MHCTFKSLRWQILSLHFFATKFRLIPHFPINFMQILLYIRWYKIFFVMLKFVWLHLIIQFFLAQKIHKKGENSSFRNIHWSVQNQYLLMSFYFFCQPYFTNNLTLEKWMVMFSIYKTAIYPQCGTVTYLNSKKHIPST